MVHPRGEDNAVCVECKSPFHKAPSLKLKRCPTCRVGKQGVRHDESKAESKVEPESSGQVRPSGVMDEIQRGA